MSGTRTIFLHSKDITKEERETIEPLLSGFDCEWIKADDWRIDKEAKDVLLLTYLSDEELKLFIPLVSEKDVTMAVLPHPKGVQSRVGYGVSPGLAQAVAHLRTDLKAVTIDSMYCNDRPVFNNVIIGDTFQLVTTGRQATAPRWKRIKYVVGKFFTLRPFSVKVNTPKKEIETAVAGIVVVQHGKGSMLSRLILEDSFANDNRLHAILISPRSLMQLALFAIRSVFKRRQLPPFAAHIKTNEIMFSGSTAFDFSEDGISQSAKELKIEILPKQLKMLPGEFIKTANERESSSDVFRVSQLPMKESARVMAGKKLPFIKHASTEEFQSLFTVLRSNADLTTSYIVLMVLSTMLGAFGIFANSTPVVIGAMILAPLMAPIISLSMATLRQDNKLAISSAKTILGGLFAGFLCAVLLTFITPITTPNNEILSRIRPNLLDLGIAVLSGVAGAYAHAREEIAKTLAGVAIAVALVPPLAVSAIGLAWMDWGIFLGALLLLLTNLAGMVLAGAITFLVMGYSPFRLAKKGVILSLIFVVILSLPLALSFQRMVQEHNIVARIEALEYDEFKVKEARVIRLTPLTVGITVIADHNLSEIELDEIKQSLEGSLNREVELEITVAIKR
ncbi:MAG: TIGR00341 family protein [Cryomorphaceae bacterium]|nr:TIGR00341 family protein [Flavobacteriales bacterium]